MPFWSWSKTAASNATADTTINWAEGQSPSSVNDSARAVMAALAKYRDDMSGSITTGGTSSAYTVTSNSVFDTLAHMNLMTVAFTPHATNAASPTLNVDGLGAKPLRSAPSTELGAGVLVLGTPYIATYFNATTEWIIQNYFGSAFVVPVGAMLPFTGTAVPNSSFVFPSGQAISRTTYATYFAMASTTYGVGDGVTTFNVPDMRSRTVFGKGDMNGAAAGRITVAGGNFDETVLGQTGGGQNQTLTTAQIPAHSHTGTTGNPTTSPQSGIKASGAATAYTSGPNALGDAFNLPNHVHAFTTDNAGGGGSHPIMPPAIMLPYILRII